MLRLLKSLFVLDPTQRLTKTRDKKYQEALMFQRSGELRGYARLMAEIHEIDAQIEALKQPSSSESPAS